MNNKIDCNTELVQDNSDETNRLSSCKTTEFTCHSNYPLDNSTLDAFLENGSQMEMKTAPMEWMKKSNSTNVLMILSFTVSLMGVAFQDTEYWMVSMIVLMVLMK